MPHSIAVFYLARLAEGFAKFEQFLASYKKHPAGVDHDFVIIAKGFTRPTEKHLLNAICSGFDCSIIYVADDIGQDIHSYRAAASQVEHEFVCFFNTHTQLMADDWLKKLYNALVEPDVGLVGATGSFESLYNSHLVLQRAFKACHLMQDKTAAWDIKLLRDYEFILGSHFPSLYRLTDECVKAKRWRRITRDMLYGRRLASKALEEEEVIGDPFPGGMSFVHRIPSFPNPHIRSNAFMLRREEFLANKLKRGEHKFSCCEFESNGLSRGIMESGRSVRVVGADGCSYAPADWPLSRTFRSDDQSNLLASDNQTDTYDSASKSSQELLRALSWGAYEDTRSSRLLGIPLSGECDLSLRFAKSSSLRSPKFSIVLPSHNGGRLVGDAIRSVLSQDYQNFEVLVFDNASSPSLRDIVEELNDPRIKYRRSDVCLPVTDSWNSAFDMVSGDYVIMIGDDDGLCPWYFKRARELITQFNNPDAIYSSLYQFFHPGVLPDQPLGVVRTMPTAQFLTMRDFAFLVDKSVRQMHVDNSLAIRRSFFFNMPAFTCKASFLDRLRGNTGRLLQPPFPDYYFANMVFEKAEALVGEPTALGFQGVSRKSFGFTLVNNRTEEGFKTLGHATLRDPNFPKLEKTLLPVSEYQNQYLLTMQRVADVIGDPARQPARERYRQLQIMDVLRKADFSSQWKTGPEANGLLSKLSKSEIFWAERVSWMARKGRELHPYIRQSFERLDRDLNNLLFRPQSQTLNSGDFVDGFDFYKGLRDGRIPKFRAFG